MIFCCTKSDLTISARPEQNLHIYSGTAGRSGLYRAANSEHRKCLQCELCLACSRRSRFDCRYLRREPVFSHRNRYNYTLAYHVRRPASYGH